MTADPAAHGWTAGDIATVRRALHLAEVEMQTGAAGGAARWLRITEALVLNIRRMRGGNDSDQVQPGEFPAVPISKDHNHEDLNMRQMTTDQRMQMLYRLLPPSRPADQTMISGWRPDDITVAMHALRRARVQARRGRRVEAVAWLRVAEQIVHVVFQRQDEIDDNALLAFYHETDPGEHDDDMGPFSSHVDAFSE